MARVLLGTTAVVALLLVLVGVVLNVQNQSLRREVTERQQVISQGVTASHVYTRLVNSIAVVAARDNDEALRGLLTQQGISVPEAKPAPQPGKGGK